MELTELREQIDKIDKALVDLYEERMEVCRNVAQFKISTGKKVLDKERELAKIEAVKGLAHSDFNKLGVAELFEHIMSMSRKLQYRLLAENGKVEAFPFTKVDNIKTDNVKVVFQGAVGAYSQAAMVEYFGREVDSYNVETFKDAMEELDCQNADYAVLPIENSTAGSVSEVNDLLMDYDNCIVGEQVIAINHCLLGTKDSTMEDIKRVYSHPQSFMQSAHFLNEMGWEQITLKNNAFAAKKVSEEQDKTQAAIASEYAAEAYGLKVLKKGVNDVSTNATRFLVLSREKIYKKDAGRISICVEIEHKSGALYQALSHFIYNGLNMTRIESRPIENKDWEYRFFIDFEGNLDSDAVKNALFGLQEEAGKMKILGNY